MSVRVVVADDHKIMRDGLRSMLSGEVGIEIVGEAENGRETIRVVEALKPDVVILDVTMPELNGIEATRQIVQKYPGIRIIALTMHASHCVVTGMIQAGAVGFLLKEDCTAEELVKAIHTVTSDRNYLSSSISHIVFEEIRRTASAEMSTDGSMLTPREREVLQLLVEGKHNRDIAGILSVSIKTVDTHRHHIYQKLQCDSQLDLIKYAIREGIISAD